MGIGFLISAVTNANWSHLHRDDLVNFDAVGRSLAGVNIAQLAIGVLGVLLVTGEYGTGMIRSTFTAIPQRLPVIWAKASVYAVITLVLMVPSSFIAFLGGQALLGSHGVSLSAPHAVRAIVGVALYLTVIGVLAVALGFCVRSTAGGISTLFGLLLVLPGLGNLLPTSWQTNVLPYLPSRAGNADLRPAARPRHLGTVDRFRRSLPLDRSCAGTGRPSGSPPRRVTAHPQGSPSLLARLPEPLALKVPEIIALFWVVKILTTAGGEATSDFLAHFGNVVGGGTELLVFVVAMTAQFATRRYQALPYWSFAYAIAIFGTGVADFLHLDVGIPYAGTSALWAVILGVIFLLWYRYEGTLSIHSVTTSRREIFYWSTVFATFALGTAVGDYTAIALKLGYLPSGFLFTAIILVPALAHWLLGLNSVVAFWSAYVVTRPLGASFADYISKPRSTSGAGFGDGPTVAVFSAAVLVLVIYLAVVRPRRSRRAAARPRLRVLASPVGLPYGGIRMARFSG